MTLGGIIKIGFYFCFIVLFIKISPRAFWISGLTINSILRKPYDSKILESVLVSRGRYSLKQKYLNNRLSGAISSMWHKFLVILSKSKAFTSTCPLDFSLSHTSLFLECPQKPQSGPLLLQSTFRHTCFSSWHLPDQVPWWARQMTFVLKTSSRPSFYLKDDIPRCSFVVVFRLLRYGSVRMRDPSNTSSFGSWMIQKRRIKKCSNYS